MIRVLLINIFFLFYSTLCHSQDTRIEIKLNRIPSLTEVFPLNNKEFLLFYSGSEGRFNTYNSWNVSKFNVNFEEQWNKIVEIPSRYKIESKISDTTNQRFIWISKSTTQLRIDLLDLANGTNQSQTYSLNYHTKEIVSAKILGNNLYLLLSYGPDDQANNCFSMCCFISVPLNMAGLGLFKNGTIFSRIDLKTQLKYDEFEVSRGIITPDKIQNNIGNDSTFYTSIYKQKQHAKGRNYLIINSWNKKLNSIDSFSLEAPPKIYFQNIQLINSKNGFAAVGTFNSVAPQMNENINNTSSQGFYTAMIDSNHLVKNIKVIHFTEIKSFENFIEKINSGGQNPLSESHKKRIQKRYKNYSTLLKFNEIIERQNDFITIAEAYHAIYATYPDINGNLIQYFEGYNYTHCLVICFDKNGNIKWDKTIPLNFNRLYNDVSQKIEAYNDGQKIQLSFSSNGNINAVEIENDIVSEPRIINLPRISKDDILVNEFSTDLTPWYGKKYLIWGAQKIKTSDIKTREGENIIYLDELEIR